MLKQIDDRPMLTVVAWPEGFSREDMARLLFEKSGMDEATMRLRLGKAPPSIIGTLADVDAQAAVKAIAEKGGDAFTFTYSDLAGFGPTLKVKDLRMEHGRLVVDIWRGSTTTIRREDVQILIRAHLSEQEVKRDVAPNISTSSMHSGFSAGAISPAALGAYGLAIGFASAYEADSPATLSGITKDIKTSDKLDIHTTDGKVYQIDGDKFSYKILGDLRGHSDKVNMDAMCELLAHLAPDEIVDPYYTLWTPPPGHQRLKIEKMKINNDDPAFAFYSRWAALLYRHVLNG